MELLGRHGGLVDVAAARTAGVDPSRLRRLAIAGQLTRVAEGVYADASMLVSLGEWQVHRLKARGYLFSCATDADAGTVHLHGVRSADAGL
jgi:cytochrome oxidase assembly protein ShyY1